MGVGIRVVLGGWLTSFSIILNAVVLGDIVPYSAAGEPLLARIPLYEVDALSPEQVQVRVFQRSYDHDGFPVSRLEWVVEEQSPSEFYVRLTSQQPMRDSFIEFFLSVDWPAGHALREYSVLLEPPLGELQKTHIHVPEKGSRGAARPIARPVVHYKTTQPGDNLWVIARDSIRNTANTVSVQQMMLAIYLENPRAFVKENMNALKSGVRLFLPETVVAEGLSHQEAVAKIAHDSAVKHPPVSQSPSPAPVLKLLTAVEETAVDPQQALHLLQETLVAELRQGKELQEQVDLLKTQFNEMRTVLAARKPKATQEAFVEGPLQSVDLSRKQGIASTRPLVWSWDDMRAWVIYFGAIFLLGAFYVYWRGIQRVPVKPRVRDPEDPELGDAGFDRPMRVKKVRARGVPTVDPEDDMMANLDLAKAYIDLGDIEQARILLKKIATLGSGECQREAERLLERVLL
jgi:FimV-like protein